MTNIYCDGACKGNPGKSGSGIIVYQENGSVTRMSGKYQENGTNNTAELIALEISLLAAKKIGGPVSIHTDSNYAKNAITKWAYSWKKNNWTKKGSEIKNLDLIKRTHELYDSLGESVDIFYVKAHCGIEGNEEADQLANLAIEEKIINIRTIS